MTTKIDSGRLDFDTRTAIITTMQSAWDDRAHECGAPIPYPRENTGLCTRRSGHHGLHRNGNAAVMSDLMQAGLTATEFDRYTDLADEELEWLRALARHISIGNRPATS